MYIKIPIHYRMGHIFRGILNFANLDCVLGGHSRKFQTRNYTSATPTIINCYWACAHVESRRNVMAIYQYFKKASVLSNPDGPLSSPIEFHLLPLLKQSSQVYKTDLRKIIAKFNFSGIRDI